VILDLEARNDAVDDVIGVGRFFGSAGDDERGARLVDQDRIDLVDDGEVMRPLDVILQVELHVVAQIVETELVVLAVGDVAGVGGLAFGIADAVHDHADAETEEAVNAAHPLRVAPRQVVVDRHDMHAAAAQRVEHGGERGDQGLAFAGLHLGDPASMEHHPADQLHVEMTLAEGASRALAHYGEDLGQNVVQRSGAFLVIVDRAYPGLPSGDPLAQALVALGRDLWFKLVDRSDGRPHPFEVAVVLRAKDFAES